MPVKPEIMQQLGKCATREELSGAVRALCKSFGKVRKVNMVVGRYHRVYCFVELESAQNQQALREALDAFEFGHAICIELHMHPEVQNFWLPGA